MKLKTLGLFSLLTLILFLGMGLVFSIVSPPVYGAGTANAWNLERATTDLNVYFSTSGLNPIALQLNQNGQMRARSILDLDNPSYVLDPSNATTSLTVAGKIGIGTLAPAAPLHVAASSSTSTGAARFGHTNLTQAVDIGHSGIQKYSNNGYNDLLLNGQGTGNLLLQTVATGNVGIGTTTPGGLLQVGNYSGASDSKGGILVASGTGVGGARRYWIGAATDPTTHNNNNFAISDYAGPGGNTPLMTIYGAHMGASAGFVGIGTTAPQAKLTIEGGAGDQLQFYKAVEDGLAIQTTLNSQPISTYGGDLPNRLLLQPVVGNVGIGTTAPLGKLHIIGNGEDGLLFYNPGNDLFGIQTTLNNQPNNGYGGTANKLSLQPVAGFVGIHKANPISDLHIKQSSDSPYAGGILLENVAGNLAPIFLGADAKTNVYSGSSGGFIRINTGGGVENNSSKLIKENFTALNFDDVLGKIDQLPVMEWNFKNQDPSIKHIGPFAEDFYSIFGLNDDDKTINAPDAAGVTLAGVKALSEKSKKQQSEIELLKQEIESLKQDIRKLQQ